MAQFILTLYFTNPRDQTYETHLEKCNTEIKNRYREGKNSLHLLTSMKNVVLSNANVHSLMSHLPFWLRNIRRTNTLQYQLFYCTTDTMTIQAHCKSIVKIQSHAIDQFLNFLGFWFKISPEFFRVIRQILWSCQMVNFLQMQIKVGLFLNFYSLCYLFY